LKSTSNNFYNHLKDTDVSLAVMMLQKKLFKEVPEDWHVIVTDIKGSTNAVANGLHETVNYIATGSIVAVLNLAYKANITVPFFFGGDGATFIVPVTMLQAAMQALQLYSANTTERVGLELRAGTVSVAELYKSGHQLLLGKIKISTTLAIPVLLGDGLAYAESIIKGEDYLFHCDTNDDCELDLNGMQCRWDNQSSKKR
jgi:hypothetical protein